MEEVIASSVKRYLVQMESTSSNAASSFRSRVTGRSTTLFVK